jgi:DMATS type aromatic prenyltransferase
MGANLISREAVRDHTFSSFAADRLGRLCRATGMESDQPRILEAFDRFSRPWSRWRIGERPRWYPSVLSDDHAPFELSAGFAAGETEIQCYWEAQGEPPSLLSNMSTGLSILEGLACDHGLSLARWRAVADLFVPEQPSGLFTILFGATWRAGRPPRFKIYLNPYVRGSREMPALMGEAMARLGFARAWAVECEQRAQRGPKLDELAYLCLDLSSGPEARVKVYRRHYRATVAELGALASIARDYQPGDAERFYGVVAAHPGPFTAKPPITSLTFREGDEERMGSVTLEFPISSYVDDDATASARIERCFLAHGLAPVRYRRAVEAIATRPLDRGNGIHAHITHRRMNGATRLSVYFATEAYPVEVLTWPSGPETVRSPLSRRRTERRSSGPTMGIPAAELGGAARPGEGEAAPDSRHSSSAP